MEVVFLRPVTYLLVQWFYSWGSECHQGATRWRWRNICVEINSPLKPVPQQTGQLRKDLKRWRSGANGFSKSFECSAATVCLLDFQVASRGLRGHMAKRLPILLYYAKIICRMKPKYELGAYSKMQHYIWNALVLVCGVISMLPGSYIPQIYTAHNGNMTKGPMFPSSTHVLSQCPVFPGLRLGFWLEHNKGVNVLTEYWTGVQ